MNQETKICFIANDGTKQFYFNFCVWQAQDVRVEKNGIILDASEYEVELNELPTNPNFGHEGGSITLRNNPKNGDKITIFRQLTLERQIAYQPQIPITPSTLNMDFNYVMETLRDFNRRLDELGNFEHARELAAGMQIMAAQVAESLKNMPSQDLSEYAKLSDLPAIPDIPQVLSDSGVVRLLPNTGITIPADCWARRYDNGWVEQGGMFQTVEKNHTTWGQKTITLPVPMADTEYFAQCTGGFCKDINYGFACRVAVKATTSIRIDFLNVIVGTEEWHVRGFAAD
jgi:hypothetical protein